MKTKLFFFIIITVSSFTIIYAQSVFEPVNSSVYSFLERLTIKDIINYHDDIKPISRKEIASFLINAEKNSDLTEIDKKDLKFYEEEYADEIDMITGKSLFNLPSTEWLSSNRTGRLRLFNYRDSTFSIYMLTQFWDSKGVVFMVLLIHIDGMELRCLVMGGAIGDFQ